VADVHGSFGFPVVVRPVSASLLWGGTLARDEMELESALDDVFRLEDCALVERFIQGRPVSVGILDGAPWASSRFPRVASWAGLRSVGARGQEPARPSGCRASARLGPAPGDPSLRCPRLRRTRLRGDAGQRTSQRDHRRHRHLSPPAAHQPLPIIASQAGLDYNDFIEEILRGARLRAHGHHSNRRVYQATFEGPDRRATAVPEAH
jgi:D-alanine-D-alanine ligase